LPFVFLQTGVISDDELLDLLDLSLSSDTSNTVIRARELLRSRIDPLQLISQLANLIMDILAGKCELSGSEIRRRFSDKHICKCFKIYYVCILAIRVIFQSYFWCLIVSFFSFFIIAEASMHKLSHALRILSETEKQLRISKNQTTWFTAALLQLSSIEYSSVDANDTKFCLRAASNRGRFDFFHSLAPHPTTPE
jgi:DNA polymerase III gamma/tau subunit